MIPLITIEGATASGKTALAIALAQALQTEIISADSRQVYRFLDIGTAKPSVSELQTVPHHLISIIDPDRSYSAGHFANDAALLVNDLHRRSRIPIICGGTGLYVRSLLSGLFESNTDTCRIKEDLIHRAENEGVEKLYRELQAIDPLFAARISSQDRQRIIRGLEVWLATGISLSDHWRRQKKKQPYHAFRILLAPDREILYRRINIRVTEMVDRGLLDEMRDLLAKGYNAAFPGLNTLGYKELLLYYGGIESLQNCLDLIRQHTRNYAKRQLTWYRKCNFHLTLTSPDLNISDVNAAVCGYFQV